VPQYRKHGRVMAYMSNRGTVSWRAIMSGPRGETSLMGWFYRFATAEGSISLTILRSKLKQTSLWI